MGPGVFVAAYITGSLKPTPNLGLGSAAKSLGYFRHMCYCTPVDSPDNRIISGRNCLILCIFHGVFVHRQQIWYPHDSPAPNAALAADSAVMVFDHSCYHHFSPPPAEEVDIYMSTPEPSGCRGVITPLLSRNFFPVNSSTS